jgi:hypothetical protein
MNGLPGRRGGGRTQVAVDGGAGDAELGGDLGVRLASRLVAQIQRVLDINHLSVVTKEVVEAARESLVIGVM